MPPSVTSHLDPELYTVAWLAPLEIEARAALHMLDRRHDGKFPVFKGCDYVYQAGEACGHNVIIASLPAGQMQSTASLAALASQIKMLFRNVWFGLLVGVAAGVPNLSRSPPRDIRLGDVLVAMPSDESAGIVAYNLGKERGNGEFQLLRSGFAMASTETIVRSAIGSIGLQAPDEALVFLPYYHAIQEKEHGRGSFVDPGQDKDTLYQADESGISRPVQRKQRPSFSRTRVWYGAVGSGDQIIRHAEKRDELRDKYSLIGLESGAAGVMNRIPVGVIRGVCDYADAHADDEWQPYAAAMAAAYARAILAEIPPRESNERPQPNASEGKLENEFGKALMVDDRFEDARHSSLEKPS